MFIPANAIAAAPPSSTAACPSTRTSPLTSITMQKGVENGCSEWPADALMQVAGFHARASRGEDHANHRGVEHRPVSDRRTDWRTGFRNALPRVRSAAQPRGGAEDPCPG